MTTGAGALFDDPQGANLAVCERMVDEVLSGRGLDPVSARLQSEPEPAWSLVRGSAEIFVHLVRSADGRNYLRVRAPVHVPGTDPARREALHQRLLELNAGALTGAAFALSAGAVVITAERSTEGLDPVEVGDLIDRVSAYADQYDDQLVAEFGGRRHSDL